MGGQTPGKKTPLPIGYLHFVIALCAGLAVGTLGLLCLEYYGFIDYAKNWP